LNNYFNFSLDSFAFYKMLLIYNQQLNLHTFYKSAHQLYQNRTVKNSYIVIID
jgi:hypothetical protein